MNMLKKPIIVLKRDNMSSFILDFPYKLFPAVYWRHNIFTSEKFVLKHVENLKAYYEFEEEKENY